MNMVIEQEGIKISIKNRVLVVEFKGTKINLTEDNTDFLRLLLNDSFKSWKCTRKEKSARNKALWSLAKLQNKQSPDRETTIIYKKMEEEAKEADEIGSINFPDVEIDFLNMELPDFLK